MPTTTTIIRTLQPVVLPFIALVLLAGCASRSPVADRLPVLGHRNWIAIVDGAYPDQVAPGVVTIATGQDQLALVRQVLAEIATQSHVRPVAVLDQELAAVAEADAPGITAYREELTKVLAGLPSERRPHEEIIRDLDRAGSLVRVVILKSTLAKPYTSVFLRLECGYWSPEAEARLRQALAKP